MKTLSLALFTFFLSQSLLAQDSVIVKKDTGSNNLFEKKVNHKRIVITGAINIAVYGGTMSALYQAWYKNYPQSNFHFFNDNKEWLQVDKAGHAWSAYSEGRASIEMWTSAGVSRKKAVWIGGMSGLAYQSIIEILDGFSSEWGFSWGDYSANILGSGMLIAQQLAWRGQRIQFKFSSGRKSYGNNLLNQRADDIYGTNLPERLLKDYNAQTYWLSTNVKSFFKDVSVPAWLNISIGYGAEGMFGAVENKWTDKSGINYDRTDIKRYRQWYLAPDIDFTKIKTKNKFMKTVFFVLNSFKFPAPALELSNNKLKWNWLHF